ncbi:parallel beta-helix repeat (two copies) [Marivirga sericea]|uniref:Parallel beta-helix repeat (Two copies) n=1 Tax=Marivirga sericea TaxID=1028 RepID=A0A1X7JL92_9BACT|nr:right-handed parallel beta-helix repeat-containing protein [Marivirga sericea]SMG28948.1 parallel beta-helix repeat (two copies) [Marivirga sericea]
MKNITYLILIFIILNSSCGKDNIEGIGNENDIVSDVPENTITTPCSFNLSDLTADSTIKIDCLLDLNGQTITLPNNVNFEFGGGDIINGKLIFSNGTIDGRLLSSKLEIEGEVSLASPTFKFYAVRWGIVEGKTTSEVALSNTAILEKVFFLTKNLEASTFLIDKLDAFFEVTKTTSTATNANWYPTLEAVNLPSNFNLKMTDNTHLRIYPGDKHNRKGGAILAVRDAENITVTGGNLYGDRDQRVFSADDNGLEGSHLFYIHSGRNIVVDGVRFQDGSSGTFAIFSFGFSYNPDYNPTQNVTIKNCIIKNSRRMAIALVDGRDITIENNTFIDAGQPSTNTDGGEVGYAINIEPERFRDENGILKERQRVFDVLIKGNTESGSRGGFLTLTIGQDITVEDNDIGSRVVYSLISGAKIINNRFKAIGTASDSWAIFAAGSGETVFNNEIANNTIEGYNAGIIIGTKDAFVHDNTITNCEAGIQLSKATNVRIHTNTMTVEKNGIQATNTNNDDIEIKDNSVTSSSGFLVYFAQMNNNEEHENQKVVFDNNSFHGSRAVTFSNTNGVIFINNEVDGGLEIGNAKYIEVTNNMIKPKDRSGIRLFETHLNTVITNNTIYVPTGGTRYSCIENNSTTPNEVNLNGNTCN